MTVLSFNEILLEASEEQPLCGDNALWAVLQHILSARMPQKDSSVTTPPQDSFVEQDTHLK